MANITKAKCVLVVGATSGIGQALALSILSLPSKPTVIVAGRRQERLDELTKEHAGTGRLEGFKMNIDTDRATLKKTIDDIVAKYPKLDAVILSAGIQRELYFNKPETVDLDSFASELNTNYTAIVTAITYLLPHFLKLGSTGQPCFIVPVTSGLAFAPAGWIPGYCATKAAMHSFSLSLSLQLEGTNVHVMESIPPLVESELHDHEGTTEHLSKVWMPLSEFTKSTMEGLERGDAQITVGFTKVHYDKFEAGKVDLIKGLWANAPK